MDEARPRYCRGENVNLVHEAMAREATEDGKKPKKEEKKNARTRFIATFLTWILLNLIWLKNQVICSFYLQNSPDLGNSTP